MAPHRPWRHPRRTALSEHTMSYLHAAYRILRRYTRRGRHRSV